jgi:ankyrin repeat protein
MNNTTSSTYKAIKTLLRNKQRLPESEILTRLRSLLENAPRVVLEQGSRGGYTLLHIAAQHSNPIYCKLLLEFDPTGESLKLSNANDDLPFHLALLFYNIETARYLLEAYPESINAIANGDQNCLHKLVYCGDWSGRLKKDSVRTIEFMGILLQQSPGLISAATTNGNLPLHIACSHGEDMSTIKFLYNTYPEAIYLENNERFTPLGVAQEVDIDDDDIEGVISFFRDQLAILEEARNVTTPDSGGQLPIHRAMLNEHVSVGTVKLVINFNAGSVLIADLTGNIPLHLACQHCSMDIIECLVNSNAETLQIKDSSGDLPLHIACQHGKCDAVQWILEMTNGSWVSMENKDGELPIQLLLYEASCDRDGLEYVQAVNALLRAHPEAVAHLLA